jgi:hypothetical protein
MLLNAHFTNQKLLRLLSSPLIVVKKSEMTAFIIICDEKMT